jgi:dehydrogenase/reductase SDR family member 12
MIGTVVDAILEAPIAPSFTRVGYALRRHTADWRDLDSYELTGRTIAVTGATSGLGRHTATRLAGLGATVVVIGRSADRTTRAAEEIARSAAPAGVDRVHTALADMGELDDVRALADQLRREHPTLDTIVHNAGALSAERRFNSAGIEVTVASQVLGPFLLTSLLLPTLRSGERAGRVITVSSGGMYATGLTVRHLQMGQTDYRGSEQYARAKRAQVTLNEMWASRVPHDESVFHAMHPGWADTPGVAESLPTFRKVTGPLLRSVEQGADTIVWLAADDAPAATSGEFWHDRRVRSIHKLPTTRRTDTAERRAELWAWCAEHTGVESP